MGIRDKTSVVDLDLLVRGTNPDPDPFSIKQKYCSKKNLNSCCFVTFFWYKQKNLVQKISFFVGVLKVNDENGRIRSL